MVKLSGQSAAVIILERDRLRLLWRVRGVWEGVGMYLENLLCIRACVSYRPDRLKKVLFSYCIWVYIDRII